MQTGANSLIGDFASNDTTTVPRKNAVTMPLEAGTSEAQLAAIIPMNGQTVHDESRDVEKR